MNLRDALRLKAGDVVSYARNKSGPDDKLGEVVRVTERGGILIKDMGWWADDGLRPDKAPPGAAESWLPYHHVWQTFKKPRVKFTPAERKARAKADADF